MEVSPTPRQIAKALLNGELPSRPLFLPVVFSLGAKVENVPLAAFLNNPTKISNSLRQMRGPLRADGVACYFDPCLEVEALGASLERFSENQPPAVRWPQSAQEGKLSEGLRSPEEAAQSGRVPVAVEVIRRMNVLPNRDFLLIAGVTGPMTLAARITQLDREATLRTGDMPSDAQELAASVVTQIATAFLEAGADLLLIQEDILPIFSSEHCDAWANLLAPTINVARFYEALPVLQLADARAVFEHWDTIFRQQWDCVVGVPAEAIASRQQAGHLSKESAVLGISLPLEAFRSEDLPVQHNFQSLFSALRPAIVTTAGDVPISTDMKRLIKVLGEVPRVL